MHRTLIWVLAALTLPAAALSVAGPPLPPLGWEESATPGFQPPIEETLVLKYHAGAEERELYAKQWGEKAVPVLQRLYRDPAWSEYRDVIQKYVLSLGGNVSTASQEEKMREFFHKLRDGDDLEPEERSEFHRIRPNATDAMRAIAKEAYAAADAEQQSQMSNYVALISGDDPIPYFEACLKVSKGEANQKRFSDLIDTRRAIYRAKEPMSVVLEKEAASP
jgi:hypothetical protein